MTSHPITSAAVDGSPPDLIFHVALRRDWEEARNAGDAYRRSTRGRSLAEVGFIHCSFADQVTATASRLYPDDEVIVLTIDPSVAGAPVVIECADGAAESYPHLYGPLPLAAVVAIRTLDDPAFGRPIPGTGRNR